MPVEHEILDPVPAPPNQDVTRSRVDVRPEPAETEGVQGDDEE